VVQCREAKARQCSVVDETGVLVDRENLPVAHMAEGGKVHLLSEHLLATASRAEASAARFDSASWARVAGLWHDIGKFSADFQEMIRAANGVDAHVEGNEARRRVNHSSAGAIHADKRLGLVGRLLAYLIAGHHAGLADWGSEHAGQGALRQRLTHTELLDAALAGGPTGEILDVALDPKDKPMGRDRAFWIRMLFSCLVDADFLDTEAFYDPGKASQRGQFPTLGELLPMFNEHMEKLQAKASQSTVNTLRAQILDRCVAQAEQPPAIFSLTVPTGGGKTLASLAFALRHALRHGKRRIIYVIPYTSIIEQTADVFRGIFGDDALVEHHSNLDPPDPGQENHHTRLACENWDAPIIVTTSVQFFESLFAARTSRCRKLHNVVDSVVILDEAQLLPVEFLNPILFALRELHANYGVSLLLCTATQPALASRRTPSFTFSGLDGVIEIMEDPDELHRQLKRVAVRIPEDLQRPREWPELAEEISGHESVLCVVNRRDDCRLLHSLMPAGTYHLSTRMCGQHRSERIAEIKRRLVAGEPTRVVSTQLVEAGVDLDFPVVYRALAGLDSIAQAAGRCNREGRLDRGQVFVFVPPKEAPPGLLRQGAQLGRRMLGNSSGDPLVPERFREYFEQLYWLQGERLDRKGVLADLAPDRELRFNFRSAASKFRMIDDQWQAPVVVRYGEGANLIPLLGREGPTRWLFRKLQRFTVNVPRNHHQWLVNEGRIEERLPGIFVQVDDGLYRPDVGIDLDLEPVYRPDDLIG